MTDRAAVVLAAAVAAGAWWSAPVPRAVGAVVFGLGLVRRSPWLLCAGGLLLAAALGHRAWAGLAPPAPEAVEGAAATLVTDPEPEPDGVHTIIRLGGRRLEAVVADRAEGDLLDDALAGERLIVSGRIVPIADRPDLAVRHVAGRLVVHDLAEVGPGDPLSRMANGLRRTIVRGAQPLGPERTALLTGILLGDDREQSPATTDDFRASGLSHLLAVSGQNVAFVLVVAGPLLRRLGLGSRFLATMAVLGWFALLTRFEPSVLRATAMAVVAVGAATAGRPVDGRRGLALAVTGLVLIDPLLVHSVGFGLSVLATAGIVVLAPQVEARLPGPRWFTVPAAVTLAAQVAVAPLLAVVFGGVPLAGVPANLLAGPAAGALMVWGLVAGPIAGVVADLAPVLHLPTGWALGWLAGVARGAAAVPLGELQVPHLVALAVLVAVARALRRSRRAIGALVGLVAALPALTLARQPDLLAHPVAAGATLWRSGPATVVRLDGRARAAPVLEGLRRVGVRRVGLVLVRSRSVTATDTAGAISERGRTSVAGAEDERTPGVGSVLVEGPFRAEVRRVDDGAVGWLVRVVPPPTGSVRSPRARGARSPPLRRHPPGAGHGDPEPDARLVLRPGRDLGLGRVPQHGRAPGR